MSEKYTKLGFTVIQMVEIPFDCLRPRVVRELQSRQIYVDTDTTLSEQIFCGDVFDKIIEEYDNFELKRLDEEDVQQLKLYAKEVRNYELVRINKI